MFSEQQPEPQPLPAPPQQIVTETEPEKPVQKKRIIVRKQTNVIDNGDTTTKKRRT